MICIECIQVNIQFRGCLNMVPIPALGADYLYFIICIVFHYVFLDNDMRILFSLSQYGKTSIRHRAIIHYISNRIGCKNCCHQKHHNIVCNCCLQKMTIINQLYLWYSDISIQQYLLYSISCRCHIYISERLLIKHATYELRWWLILLTFVGNIT